METAGVLKPQARYGLDRVLEPPGAFPQPAWRLDPDPRSSAAEILIDVGCLDLDSASFHQLSEELRENPAIRAIFERRYGAAV